MKFRTNIALLSCVIMSACLPDTANSLDLSCNFTTNCLEASRCNPIQLQVIIIRNGRKSSIQTPGLTFAAIEREDNVNNTLSYVTNMEKNATHLLTVFSNGEARFTGHTFLQNAISSTYIGICKEIINQN